MKHSIPTSVPALLALSALCGAAGAQTPDSFQDSPPLAPEAAARVVRDAFGVDEVDGRIVAGGPDYKAHFEDGRMRFTPAFGKRADRNYPVTFAFEGVSRGDVPVSAAVGIPPATRDGNQVAFARAGGVVERYDVTREGLLQSFLVPNQPGGDGDLVVRGAVLTDLVYAGRRQDGGVAFELPGVGGVTFGGVTAIGADGDSVAGELRFTGDALELVVPDAFVDGAAYPLIIDPKINPYVAIDDNTWNDSDPAIASTSADGARYLVVWERHFSLSDGDLRAFRLDKDADYAGNFIYLEDGPELSNGPAIGHVATSERFFVAWAEAANIFVPYQIVGRSVDGSPTGATSGKITLAASANMQSSPDVGGERTLADDDVYVVWGEANVGIRGCQVSLPVSGAAPSSFGVQLISDPVAGDENHSPSISKSAGDNGLFGLAYELGSTDVMYRTMTRNGVKSGAQLLLASIGGPHRNPSIDGDGTNFLLAVEKGEDFAFANSDIWGATLTYDGLGLRPFAFEPIENGAGDHETYPDVAYTGGQFLVSYLDVDAGESNAYLKTIDPFTCLSCENETLISATGGFDQDTELATFYAAGLAGDQALMVWESFEVDGDILAQVYESPNGQKDLGGGCGQGGGGAAPCAFSGNANFALHLAGAAASTPAFLVLGFQESPTACGPCTLWPSLATAQVFYAGMTDNYGRLSFPVAMPFGTSGISFTTQWGVAAGGACALFDIDVSDGVRTTVF